ncbi:hypothetical protein [Rubrivivax gelatinosus]|uniref:hypothetical protein n=1 Tax=Rubrivivax gelatinosus TaxID=28068 RepID=UPI0005C1FD28|nr:hypothetical protein [Rubrivivax gelatinosus]MBG6083032.1 hypothetical protein [Rubrivivax gelatinosus]
MIYFTTVSLAKAVHAQGLGLTSLIFPFCWGSDSAEAELNAKAYLVGSGIQPMRFHGTTPALVQDAARYTFPEEIYGIPTEIAKTALERYGEHLAAEALAGLKKRQTVIQKGLKLLAKEAAHA